MTIALRLNASDRSSAPSVRQHGGLIAKLELYDDMRAVEPHWRVLERQDALATPYQRYDFLEPWQREVGARTGVTPAVIVGLDANRQPLLLLPFGRRQVGPLQIAEYLGGKHSNFNMAIWRRDVAATVGRDDLNEVLAGLAGIDLLALRSQPESWDDIANPFLQLPHQMAPSFGQRGRLQADFAALEQACLSAPARKKLRKKERVLASHGPLRFWRVQTEAEAIGVLEAFFAQKAERMRGLGVVNAFDVPGMREFITAAATEHLRDGRPAIELYACTVGKTVAATIAGLVSKNRFCALFNSMVFNVLAHESPGELMLVNLVRMCCERRLDVFDLGVGEANYKRTFCQDVEPLFDSFLPLSPLGWTAALALRSHGRTKRRIKQSTVLWNAVGWGRRLRARMLPSA
jgi:CelD/BcsL family acetyltransferase involved in cellulose biosynthesis